MTHQTQPSTVEPLTVPKQSSTSMHDTQTFVNKINIGTDNGITEEESPSMKKKLSHHDSISHHGSISNYSEIDEGTKPFKFKGFNLTDNGDEGGYGNEYSVNSDVDIYDYGGDKPKDYQEDLSVGDKDISYI